MTLKFLLLLAILLSPALAFAQSDDERCPQLPTGSALAWVVTEGPDFLYCRAMHDADGSQAFAVMLRADSNFRSERSLREEEAVIDGHKARWYRGDVARSGLFVREAVLDLGKDSTAHIVVRADSEEQLASDRRLAEGLRFGGIGVGGD